MRGYILPVAICICMLYDFLAAVQPVDVTDLILKLPGREEKIFEYKFAAGDTIILNASAVEGNDISEIAVEEWPSTIRFQASDVEIVENKRILVPRTNIYYFRIKNKAVFKTQTYNLQIQRIPSDDEFVMFNTTAVWDTIYDTTYVATIESTLIKIDTIAEDIIKTELKLGSQMTGNTRTHIPITLPKGTSYWAYWIGVGQEAANGLQEMSQSLPEAATALGFVNPVAAFALGLIPQLFTLSQGYDVYYCFINDYSNLQNFMAGQPYYILKEGRAITDYSKMETPTQGTFYLGLSNAYSTLQSKIVTVNIVAIKLLPRYECHDIQRPVVEEKIVPRI